MKGIKLMTPAKEKKQTIKLALIEKVERKQNENVETDFKIFFSVHAPIFGPTKWLFGIEVLALNEQKTAWLTLKRVFGKIPIWVSKRWCC